MHALSGSLLLMSLWAVFLFLAFDKATCEITTRSSISCICGIGGVRIQVPIQNKCAAKFQNQHGNARCENETEKTVCSKFKFCQICDVTKRQCTSCPVGRHGRSCATKTNFVKSSLSSKHLLVKRGSDPPWKSLILGGLASKTFSQSWMTGGDTPSGLVNYRYTATYSMDAPPRITVVAQTKSGEAKEFSYNHPLTDSWFTEKFGSNVPIPQDVKILNNGQLSHQPVPAPQGQDIANLKSGQGYPTAASLQDPPWKRLILGDLASKTYSQSWMTGGDTPSGYVSYSYIATYSQSSPPHITVTAKTKSGQERVFSYNQPLTESWFKDRFGEQTAIPKDVKILSNQQPQQVPAVVPQDVKILNNQEPQQKPAAIPQVYPDVSAILGNVASKTFKQWWYSGGPESSRGFVAYNYTAVYSRSSPIKVTIIATSKNGQQTTFNFDKTPSDSWFKEMFGPTVTVPNDALHAAEQPKPSVDQAIEPSVPLGTCPLIRAGDDPSVIGTRKTFHCSDDYWRLVGPSTLICQPNGKWSAKPPTCIPKVDTPAGKSVCLLPSLSKEVTLKWSNLAAGLVVDGTVLHLSCEDKYLYKLQGSNVLLCRSDGTWNGQIPTCTPRKYDDEDCGGEVKVAPSISGGVSVPNSRPWMIHITANHQIEVAVCGGSLIKRQWVLTAAHCLLTNSRIATKITAQLDNSQELLPIERHFIHPQYELGILDYDVALLKLTKPVNRVGVLPVCLPAPDQDVRPADTGMVMGRGKRDNGERATTLQEASLTVVTEDQCKDWLKGESIVKPTQRMFCARPTAGHASVCGGDSGGPMTFQKAPNTNVWTQFGIISWASKDACNTTEEQYSGLVRIKAVLSWIRQQMADDKSFSSRV